MAGINNQRDTTSECLQNRCGCSLDLAQSERLTPSQCVQQKQHQWTRCCCYSGTGSGLYGEVQQHPQWLKLLQGLQHVMKDRRTAASKMNKIMILKFSDRLLGEGKRTYRCYFGSSQARTTDCTTERQLQARALRYLPVHYSLHQCW